MNMFCPSCGRLKRYNPDIVGLMPKVCPYCIFLLEHHHVKEPGWDSEPYTEGRLKPFGLTLVQN